MTKPVETEPVTGNALEMHEKFECAVCGRLGFVRYDEPARVMHPYSEPCILPPKMPTPRVRPWTGVLRYTRRNEKWA